MLWEYANPFVKQKMHCIKVCLTGRDGIGSTNTVCCAAGLVISRIIKLKLAIQDNSSTSFQGELTDTLARICSLLGPACMWSGYLRFHCLCLLLLASIANVMRIIFMVHSICTWHNVSVRTQSLFPVAWTNWATTRWKLNVSDEVWAVAWLDSVVQFLFRRSMSCRLTRLRPSFRKQCEPSLDRIQRCTLHSDKT